MLNLWAKFQAAWVEIAAAFVILILVFVLGWVEGGSRVKHDWDVANTKAIAKAAEEAETLAASIDETTKKNEADKAILIEQRDSAIASLRKRPDRVPRTATATCEGSTGAELSRPDAGFLIRLATDAERVRHDLIACYAREDDYRKAMKAK